MSQSSLEQFFLKNVESRLPEKNVNILELGCGSSSVFENINKENFKVTAIDNEKHLIEQAPKNSKINYLNCDITMADIRSQLPESYDLIFDSHCFQCITSKILRIEAWKNVFNLLSDDGIFAAEMMVQPSTNKLNLSERYIPESLELEQEFISAGFKINFFFISRDLIFDLNEEHDLKCDLVRVMAKK